MKYTVEMGSDVMIYISIGSGIQKLMGGGNPRHTEWGSHKPTLGK
jgi:hypothetical protein